MENLEIYDRVRTAPKDALKPITGGRLNGKTDINPMWRIKTLTELFGPCGIGWYTEITRQWLEPGAGKVAAFCNINLYVKFSGEWSKPIPGTGGAAFVDVFKGSPEMIDDAYKMAYTDAISVACKALGFAADVYWDKDRTKYDKPIDPKHEPITPQMMVSLRRVFGTYGISETKVLKAYGVQSIDQMTVAQHNAIIKNIDKFVERCGNEPDYFDGSADPGSGDPVQQGSEPDYSSVVFPGGGQAI